MTRQSWPFPPAFYVAVVGIVLWMVTLVSTLGHVDRPFPGFRVSYCLTVSEFNLPRWEGIRAGLQSWDAITAVDGHAVTTGRDVIDQVMPLKAGTPVRYEVMRHGERHVFTVPVRIFGKLDFLESFGVFFLVGLVILLVGVTAAWIRPENVAVKANLGLAAGMGLSFVFMNDYDLTHLFPPAFLYGSYFLYASSALAMALNFPSAPAWVANRGAIQAAPFVVGGALWAAVALNFGINGPTPAADEFATSLGSLWPSVVLLLSLGIFVSRFVASKDPMQRSQIRVLLCGMLLAYIPAIPINVIPRSVGLTPSPLMVNISYAFWVCFPLALTYAIVRHHMFDISIIIKRTTIYALLTAFLAAGYLTTAAAIRAVTAWTVGSAQPSEWENLLATAIITLLFVPVRSAVTKVVDRLFFRTHYNFREVVARVTTKAQSTLDLAELKQQFLGVIDEALHPKYMYILTRQAADGVLTTGGAEAVWGNAPVAELNIPSDDPVLLRTGRDHETQYVPATGLTGLLSPLAALGPHYRVPLQVGEEVVGLVVLGPKRSDEEYSAEDRELLAATRLPLASAIKTAALVEDRLFKDRVEQDLRRAREVQEAMLPRTLPSVPGYDFAGSSSPCFEASGDYFDYVELPDGRVGIAVADAAGKGIAAALATAMAKSGLYNQTQTDPEVIPVLSALNRLLHNVSKHAVAKSFTTCLYALLDPVANGLTYACAGHFPPHHYNAAMDRMTDFPITSGFPLGVRDSSQYIAQEVRLRPGDVLVFYTDGVTEAQAPATLPRGGLVEPGEQFESDRLSQVILANKGASAQAIHDAILAAVADFVAGGPQTDDITLVVLKKI